MPDESRTEYAGKSEAQKKRLKTFRACLEQSRDFVRPQFQKNVRLYRLFCGHLPPEIQGTFSQVMLGIAYAIIDEEIPISMRAQFSQKNWLSFTAETIGFEPHRKTAEKWARHQIEKVQQMSRFGVWPIQSAHIMGNGFRFYTHRNIEKKIRGRGPIPGLMGGTEGFRDTEKIESRSVITGSYINNFNVFPSPVGSLINTPDHLQDLALPYLIIMTYPMRSAIENEVANGTFDKSEVAGLFRTDHTDMEKDPSMEFKEEILGVEGEWNQFSVPEWIQKLKNDNADVDNHYRVAWAFYRDRWMAVGEDRYILYDGPPLFNGWPVANFKASHNLDAFHGTSILEPVEDLIVSMILNFNMQLDYLAGQFHPMTFMPQLLVDQQGGDLRSFDPEPYKIIPYQHKAFPEGIQNAIFHDRHQEIDRQSFMQQGEMKQYLEDIISQHGAGNVSGATATVGESLISKSVARSMLRAINLDLSGMHDCVDITMRMGAQYRNEDEYINTGAEGMPWERIDHEAITDNYGISINGARHLTQAEEIFKKQLAVAPLLLNNPQVRGQVELTRQLAEQAEFDNVDLVMQGNEVKDPRAAVEAGGSAKMPGGIPSLQNRAESVANRSDGRTPRRAAGNLV